MKVSLVKLSVCPCGFPTLKETIPLGTKYTVDPAHTCEAVLVCGGCKQETKVRCVYVSGRNGSAGGWLPEDIFGLETTRGTNSQSPIADRQ